MADGRETSLQSQATTAALVHEQAKTAPSAAQLAQIVDFELQVYVAQTWDIRGGMLGEKDGPPFLGVENLAQAAAANRNTGGPIPSFDLWRNPGSAQLTPRQRAFRESAVRGSDLFLTREFPLRGQTKGTCATCHQPGNARSMDIGTTNSAVASASPELPLFKITCNSGATPHPELGMVFYTQDPGRALITGACADVGSILMQQFRGLASRAPYFVNGSAADLPELVDFYDHRFQIGLSQQDKLDLVNFLSIL